MNISKILSQHALYRSDHLAFVYKGQRSTYAEFDQEVSRMANAFKDAGIRKGDKVATLLPNTTALWEAYWACAKIGAVVVPLSPLLREEGLVNVLNSSDADLLLTKAAMITHVEPVVHRLSKLDYKRIWLVDGPYAGYPDLELIKKKSHKLCAPDPTIQGSDLYNIIYSSGTTGLPKGIMLTHQIRAMYMTLLSNAFRITPESVIMHSGSIIFNGSFLTIMPVMYQGATFVLMPGFDVHEALSTLQQEKVTHTILVPSQIIQMLENKDFQKGNLPDLEMILTVGAPLDTSYKEELERRLPGVFYELYGLTEGFVTILDKSDAIRKMGSVGRPSQFFEMKIVDDQGVEMPVGEVGEIIGKGPFVMTGYYNDPIRTAEAIKDGWLYSGDLGYVDEDGFLFLAGRKKELIISGGVNVYPKDIEAIVLQHPSVIEVAVVGVPHDKWGETPIAAVVCREQVNSSELKSWINDRLHVRYQKVSEVIIMDKFPRNVAGKVLKRELQQRFEQKSQNQQ